MRIPTEFPVLTPTARYFLALPPDDAILIRVADVPAYTGIARNTLARWRHEGKSPQFVKLGRLVFYRAGDLRAWIKQSTRNNTCGRAVA